MNPDRRAAQRLNARRDTVAALLLTLLALWSSWTAAQDVACADPADPRVVIIIDDMGHHLERGQAAVALPGKINFAVMPYTRFGTELANDAAENGKEVLLHAPMSTVEDTPLGRGGLIPDLDRESFRKRLEAALEQVPHIRGINNHMGSDLTQRRREMAWVMQELRWRDLYFVDSRTSDKTVAATVAAEFNVPHLSRNVFLDNERDAQAIDRKFEELVARAHRDGMAVAIGHPYPETIAYLEQAMLTVHDRGVRPVFISEVLASEESAGGADVPPPPGCGSEPDVDTAAGHVGLGLGHGVLTEVEDAGGEHGVGAADENAVDQVVEITDAS